MSKPKPDKLKAHTRASVATGNNNLDGAVEILAMHHPLYAGLLKLAQISIGYYLTYKQEELNEFTEYLQDNNKVFSEELISSKEFQDGVTLPKS